jgi:DNA-binding NtrC family response regulator
MLIADDSYLILRIFREAISQTKLPVRITATDNGCDCLTMLCGRDIDLAFIDVQMPELSGTDAVWAARKLGLNTFITLMSSPPSLEATVLARKMKAYEFLFKPFTSADVMSIINIFQRITAPTKVLVVDDSQTVRQIIQKTISASIFNCTVTEAPDGATAVETCKATPLDVVFLDCNIPGLSGLDTMQRLLKLNPGLKVVMISGERGTARDLLARQYGAFAFLSKPFDAGDMNMMLHEIHGLRSPNLSAQRAAHDFNIAIEGRTIRLVHGGTGRVFEFFWFKDPPYLRNGTVQPSHSNDAGATNFH